MPRDLYALAAQVVVWAVGLTIITQQVVYYLGGPGLAEWLAEWIADRLRR